MLSTIKFAAAVEYETFILNCDGSVASHRAPKRNLILDQGLNQVATTLWCNCFLNVAVGTGTDPVKRDSGTTTFTRSGTVITANNGFFEPADVGRLFKFDTGDEAYITAFTSTFTVSVNISGSNAASEGTVWYVNLTSLQTETARTGTLSVDAGDNGTTFSVNTYTHKRTFLFGAVGAPVTYREIGWSPNGSAGANLFGRDIIPGAGDALLAGQQYKVIVRLFLTISPSVQIAQSDVGNNGYVTTGTAAHEYIQDGYSWLLSPGGSVQGGGLEPASSPSMNIFNATFTQLAAPSFTYQESFGYIRVALGNAAYTAGTFFRDASGTYSVAQANGPHYGFHFGPNSGAGGGSQQCFSVKFTTPPTKDNLHTLTVTLRRTWGRILTN